VLLLFFSVGCSGSKPSAAVPEPAPAPAPTPDKITKANQHRENAAINEKASLDVGRTSEDRTPERLEDDVRKVDDYLARFQGTKAAEEVAIWRAKAEKILEKWRAEDKKARGEPVKVPLADLLSEFRKEPAATDTKYQRKWLVVTGKVTRVTREPIYDLPKSASYTDPLVPPIPRADVVALIVKLQEKTGTDDAIECHRTVEIRPGSGGEEQGKGLDAVKEGDTVTILGRWLSPFPPFFPRETLSLPSAFVRKSCALDQCELAR
jgi:hypothetical protein